MEEFWGCVVTLQEACQLLHLCLQNDVFRHTSYTVCSAVLAVLLFSPSNPREWYLWGSYGPMWFRRIFSPVSFQESWEGQWFMAPINRDPQHGLEHLVTSDWQVFPPTAVVPSSWVVDWVIRCLWGGAHVLRCHRPDLDAAPCISLPCSSGGCISKSSWHWGPLPHLYKVVPQHETSLLALHPNISRHSWRLTSSPASFSLP